jgi:hypothetical protein
MTVELDTFYKYITNNTSDNITRFITKFNYKIDELPDKVVSSKYLIKHLGILSCVEFKIFQNVYLDYFRFKFDRTYT